MVGEAEYETLIGSAHETSGFDQFDPARDQLMVLLSLRLAAAREPLINL